MAELFNDFEVVEDGNGLVSAMDCTYIDVNTQLEVTETIEWKFFKANCPAINQLCSGKSAAWVPVVTVCHQRLF